MSDVALRALERRWLETGSVDDEERYLIARLRAGSLAERALVVAAGLGHEASLRIAPAVGMSAVELVDTAAPDCAVRARAALTVVRHMAVRYTEALGVADLPQDMTEARRSEAMAAATRAVGAATGWVLCPCQAHAGALACLEAIVTTDCSPDCCWSEWDYPGQILVLALDAIVECAGLESSRDERWFTSISNMVRWLSHPYARELGAAVRAAIRDEVVPRALGPADPLRGSCP